MPFNYNNFDCSPLVIDNEFNIHDEEKLSRYIAKVVLGHFAHIKRIIRALSTIAPTLANDDIDNAINLLTSKDKSTKDIEKRDGWVFQIISWLVLFDENKGGKFYCQQPHDAPAQHGLDGVAVSLSNDLKIERIIITEDKCSKNHRVVIPKIWDEFKLFEDGKNNNKVVSRISALLEDLDEGKVLEANKNDISSKNLWKYRVGINRNNTYQSLQGRKNLFKGYDDCVTGTDPSRRYASTIHKENIRSWMEHISNKVIKYLESEKI
jgi:hypothetical protein